MNDYYAFSTPEEDDDFTIPQLPLDWNENLSLEEYLERLERRAQAINSSL